MTYQHIDEPLGLFLYQIYFNPIPNWLYFFERYLFAISYGKVEEQTNIFYFSNLFAKCIAIPNSVVFSLDILLVLLQASTISSTNIIDTRCSHPKQELLELRSHVKFKLKPFYTQYCLSLVKFKISNNFLPSKLMTVRTVAF